MQAAYSPKAIGRQTKLNTENSQIVPNLVLSKCQMPFPFRDHNATKYDDSLEKPYATEPDNIVISMSFLYIKLTLKKQMDTLPRDVMLHPFSKSITLSFKSSPPNTQYSPPSLPPNNHQKEKNFWRSCLLSKYWPAKPSKDNHRHYTEVFIRPHIAVKSGLSFFCQLVSSNAES